MPRARQAHFISVVRAPRSSNWLVARHADGTFLVRIEDTDLKRSTKESEENIKDSLKWLGMNWDEGIDVGGPHGPYRRTERLDLYKKEVQRLLDEGKAYYCYCSAEELEKSRKAQLDAGKTPIYDEHCRHLTEEEKARYEAEGRKPVVRLKVRKDGVFAFDDMVRGHVEFQAAGVGDFIIMKSDGIPVYNFAVVIDDAFMEVTHVIRAEEHLSNTPRQLAIYEALGYKPPKFGHISLILGEDHKKMSKRHGATSVTEYRNMGYLPEAVVNYLALLGWTPKGEQEIFTEEELIKQFSMKRVSSNDAVFDINKLNWINFQYMKKLDADQLYDLIVPFLVKAGYVDAAVNEEKKDWLKKVIWFMKDHIYFAGQAADELRFFFEDMPKITDEDVLAIMKAETSGKLLKAFIEDLKALETFDQAEIKKCFNACMKAQGIKGKAAYEPTRIALTGATQGPGMFEMMELFGREKTMDRLEAALAYC